LHIVILNSYINKNIILGVVLKMASRKEYMTKYMRDYRAKNSKGCVMGQPRKDLEKVEGEKDSKLKSTLYKRTYRARKQTNHLLVKIGPAPRPSCGDEDAIVMVKEEPYEDISQDPPPASGYITPDENDGNP
jgi:hypothetical protein